MTRSQADRLVFFDLETTGLDPARNRIIQFAGVAVDADWREVDAFEVKVAFDPAAEYVADGALKSNSYDEATWRRDAVAGPIALARVDGFISKHRCVQKISQRTQRPYSVARMAGFNAAAFDMPFIRTWYGERFFPAEPRCLDVYHVAAWYSWMIGERNVSLRLQDLCPRFGVAVDGDHHDALVDVRATVALARFLAEAMEAKSRCEFCGSSGHDTATCGVDVTVHGSGGLGP